MNSVIGVRESLESLVRLRARTVEIHELYYLQDATLRRLSCNPAH